MENNKTNHLELHDLRPAEGSVRTNKRLGRGIGSTRGRTSTRGHKGAKSRSGFKNKRNFEGGQMPMQMRVPKRGFKNRNRVAYVPINLDRLVEIVEKYRLEAIDLDSLIKLGIVGKKDKVKILGGGELTSGLSVSAHAFSASAREAIEAAGGTVNLV
jgi:large subunit ribosomal protein L15